MNNLLVGIIVGISVLLLTFVVWYFYKNSQIKMVNDEIPSKKIKFVKNKFVL